MLQQIYNKIKIASFMTNVLFLLGCWQLKFLQC